MKDIDSEWYEFTEISADKLIAEGNDWSKLREEDRELAALWRLEADMNNGGYIQFFCNWGIECHWLAEQALRKINALKALAIIEEAFTIIDNARKKAGSNIKEYWEIPKYLNSAQISRLDQLDQEYWDYPDNISALGLAFYNKR